MDWFLTDMTIYDMMSRVIHTMDWFLTDMTIYDMMSRVIHTFDWFLLMVYWTICFFNIQKVEIDSMLQ